ncbi:MAG: CehA/McbA family metallohydrolase [Pseudothermotoga sp.]
MIILEGKMTVEDSKKVLFQEFEVPQNVSVVKIQFEYAPTSVGPIQNHVNLLVYDSVGRFMGRYDRGTKQFVIGTQPSSSAEKTLPLPGKWRICFENHYLFTNVAYKLSIDFEYGSLCKSYVGELHTHTVHSDGSLSVKELADYLKDLGFDFFFLTDHSNTTGWRELCDLHGIRGFPGQELNTFNGHGLVLGCNTFIDWKEIDGNRKQISQILHEVHNQHGLMGVAHPFALGDPLCVGCKWTYDFDPFKTDFVEIWNADLSRIELNFEAIGNWINNLKKGRRVTATAGRDLHRRSDTDWLKTIVFARELDLSEVLFAVKTGKIVLSYTNQVSFSVNGKRSGESLILSEKAHVEASIGQVGQKEVLLITKNDATNFGSVTEIDTQIETEVDDFVTLIVFGKNNLPLVITNPVFVKRGD